MVDTLRHIIFSHTCADPADCRTAALAVLEALREPTEAQIEAMAFEIAVRATHGDISPAKWEGMPEVHRNGWECKGFWRGVAMSAYLAAIDAALADVPPAA